MILLALNELNIDVPKFYSKSYESIFISSSLKFHRLWTGPKIPYSEYNSEKCTKIQKNCSKVKQNHQNINKFLFFINSQICQKSSSKKM